MGRATDLLLALARVLHEAQARGIDLSASFLHFDRRRQGLVGVDDLMAALVELQLSGLLWDESDAEDCIACLSAHRSRAYFSREDFVRFFSKPLPTARDDENDRGRKKPKPRRGDVISTDEDTRVRAGYSLSKNDEISPTTKKTSAGAKMARPLGSLLPHWAHARSKRALHELEQLSKTKKKRPRGSGAVRPRSREQETESARQRGVPLLRPFSPGNEAGDDEMPMMEEEDAVESARSVSTAEMGNKGKKEEHSDLVHFPVDPSWQLFDLDTDTTLSYSILTHDVSSSSPRWMPKMPGVPAIDEDAQPMMTQFRFTVFIDAFQRIATLQAFFEPLLTHFPRGKILVCGHPTKMRRQTILNNDFLAAAYAKLLVHVMGTTREWLVQPKLGIGAMPQYVLGFGSGGQVALHLFANEIPLQASLCPSLHKFALAQRGIVLFNAITNISDNDTRAVWNSWRRVLTSSSRSVECHELLLRTLFSEFYLTQVAKSREMVMEDFFRSRSGFFQGSGLTLLQSIVRGVVKNRDNLMNLVQNLAVICTPPFGVVAVHGSVAEPSPPSQVELLSSTFLSKTDSLVDWLSSAHRNTLHTAWLKCGYELLQERGGFVHDLLKKLILVRLNETQDNIQPDQGYQDSALANPISLAAESLSHHTDPHISRVDSSMWQPLQTSDREDASHGDASNFMVLPEQTSSAIGMRVRELMLEKGLKWIQQELYDRDIEGSGTAETILKRYEDALFSEAQAERERIKKSNEKERKREAFEAEKRARQQEELERIVREKEIERNIKQREFETQKNFFIEVEKQKLLHAKWEEEHRQIELEDALSVKFNEQILLEEDIEERNKQMERKVASLEREREENEQERYQVALQQRRLESQHNKRENLKKFQKEFEQNQFVCSAVEAYHLDLSPEYSNFSGIVEGTTLLAADLSRFYELKITQMDDSAEKRQQLQSLKQGIAEKELVLRNMERVIVKAKNTGMIAKAGLGTVRVVPITATEIQALARELDEKRDELARLLHDENLVVQQLAWQDKMLQRLSVLIKRNEGFRAETLKKLITCVDKGNEMVFSVREDLEALMEKRDTNEKVIQRIHLRCQLVSDEKSRAEGVTTQYFDTRLRIEGTTQRVLRTVLVKELSLEKEELEKKIAALALENSLVQSKMKERKKTLEEYAAAAFAVDKMKDILEAAVPPPPKVALSTTKNDTDHDPSENVEVIAGSQGDRARHKKHVDRSAEEKRWIAMDFTLNFAYYYKHVDPQEVEVIQRHPDYQTNKLKKPQLERLLTLPARNCLALAFLKSSEELEAHSLLQKYTFGDGEGHFAQLDRTFELPGVMTASAAVVGTLEELVIALDKETNPVLRSRSAMLLEPQVVPAPSLLILSLNQQQIPPHKTATHSFQLPTGPHGVLSLTISIVFRGHFKSTGYQNGRLAAMLYALPTASSELITAPLPIGKCQSNVDIALCTPHSLGKVVIRHDPSKKPLSTDVSYQVVLGAPVFTTYSIEIVAYTAAFPSEVLRKKKSDALKKQELLPAKKDEIQNVFTTIQLSERKKRLARKMANEAKDVGRQAELEMLRFTKLLEADNAAPTLPQDERKQLHMKIHTAESKFTEQCFVFAQREEEVRDMEAGLKELTKIHADLLEEVDGMERDLVEYREFLPALAAAIVESSNNGDRDAAGAKVAKELNVEYTSRYGARSGKVFWAELSAVKAKLPSMMTPAERLRRKYKKGVDILEKKEREWILLDRILYPRKYDWEDRLVADGDSRMRLHGTHPKLTKDEEQLAVLSQMEVERIMKAPWNLLERKEIQLRKIVSRFREEAPTSKKSNHKEAPRSVVSMLRTQKIGDLTSEEREWRMYDQVLNPVYYPVTLKNIAEEIESVSRSTTPLSLPAPPAHITREDLVLALNTPEDELFKLPSDLLHARNLLLKYDTQLSVNLVEAARIQHAQQFSVVEKVEMDVDARCRLVYAELQRAIANTRNEFMDTSALHTTLQRFPTKVLRLELEKELDRILMSQIIEKEQYEIGNFLKTKRSTKKTKQQPLNNAAKGVGDESVSDSDSDKEAQIAREQREQKRIKEAAKHGPRDKVRGKALKAKSIQKQRREIKDALQGRSLAEQRLLVEEQELGVGGCMACRTNPCVWKPYLQESFVTVRSRMEVLLEELERIKRAPDLVIESTVCLTAVKSGNKAVKMRKADLFDEVTFELKIWDKNLRLRDVDKEFHDSFTSKEQYFETQALHGFRQIQQRDKVQRALLREHNSMVSNLTAHEVVEDILEYMLEGWVFGERESERKVMGFVPSLKREGPLSMQDLRRLDHEKRVLDGQAALTREENVQGIPLDKWKPIEVAAFDMNEKNKAVKKGSELDKQLTETEIALKFGIFCMTLMYFRGLSLLKKQKTVWSTSALKYAKQEPLKSEERKRIEIEARNVAVRQKKASLYDEKARKGQARKQKVEAQRAEAYRRRMVLENQKAKREARAAVQVQRIFRGFMGRRAGRKWMLRRREIDAQRALERAAAITLQRAYRGRLGRIKAEERRVELAEFISQIRAEEAIEEEEEYWRRHRVERFVRQVAAFVKKEA